MSRITRWSLRITFALVALLAPLAASNALAQSSYYTSRGCTSCHAAPVVATCNGCHAHGAHANSTKNTINVTGTTSKASYAPGETVSVTIAGGYRTGWVRAVLYDQNQVELARSVGNASGMGSATTLPAILTAPAPTTPGTYSWKVGWYGNVNDAASAAFGANWVVDPTNPNHGTEIVSTNSFTVAAPADTTLPIVGAFTLPAAATSLTVPVSSLTATDNVGVTGYLVTTSATAPLASAAGWSAVAPTSVTAPAAGTVTFYAWAKDAAGNVSLGRSAVVVITLPDTVAPTVSAFTLPAAATSLTVPVTSLSATDNVGVTGYLVTTSATAPFASAAGWSAVAPASVTAPAAGTVTFYAWAKDAAGNVSAARSAAVVITITVADTVAPTVSAFTLPAAATNLTIPVTSLSATDNVGVTGYLVTTSATAPLASAAGWSAVAPASVIAPAAGTVTFYAWAKDAAGNVSAARSAAVVITITVADTTAPSVSAFTLPAAATSLTVPVTSLSATDNVGVTGYLVTTSATAPLASAAGWSAVAPASVIAPAAGIVTFYAWAKDAAGNVSTARSAAVVITIDTTADVTKPVLVVSTLANGSVTRNPILNVSGRATDDVALNFVKVNEVRMTLKADGSFSTALTLVEGENIVRVVAFDKAGNRAVNARRIIYQPLTLDLKITAPADNLITAQSLLEVTGMVAENATVTVTVNGKNPQLAQVESGRFSASVYLFPGYNTIAIKAVDSAGNVSSAKRTVRYFIDRLSLSITEPDEDKIVSNSTLMLKGKVADNLSLVTIRIVMDGKVYRPLVSSEGTFAQKLTFTTVKQYTINVTATDAAGKSVTSVRNVIYKAEGQN